MLVAPREGEMRRVIDLVFRAGERFMRTCIGVPTSSMATCASLRLRETRP